MSDATAVRLLVWDDPDVRRTRDRVLVADVGEDRHADFEQLYRWFARRCGAEQPEACVFTVVRPGDEVPTAARVTAIREHGFAVHVRREPVGDGSPTGAPATDGSPAATAPLSEPMWAMIDGFNRAGRLHEVIVASHDAAAFGERLDALRDAGVQVTVVGFREQAGFACGRASVGFIDLEEIDGLYGDPLPRTNLYDLPVDGRTLPPLRRPVPPTASRPSLSMFSFGGRTAPTPTANGTDGRPAGPAAPEATPAHPEPGAALAPPPPSEAPAAIDPVPVEAPDPAQTPARSEAPAMSEAPVRPEVPAMSEAMATAEAPPMDEASGGPDAPGRLEAGTPEAARAPEAPIAGGPAADETPAPDGAIDRVPSPPTPAEVPFATPVAVAPPAPAGTAPTPADGPVAVTPHAEVARDRAPGTTPPALAAFLAGAPPAPPATITPAAPAPAAPAPPAPGSAVPMAAAPPPAPTAPLPAIDLTEHEPADDGFGRYRPADGAPRVGAWPLEPAPAGPTARTDEPDAGLPAAPAPPTAPWQRSTVRPGPAPDPAPEDPSRFSPPGS